MVQTLYGKWRSLVFYMLAACLILFSSCKKSGAPNNNAEKPNIVLILGDDVGYEVFTCNGGQSYVTTAVDNLASQGMRFTQCHVCPNCSPTRVEMLTGKYNFRNYIGWGNLDRSQKTIANMLHDAGYATCVAGKWQLNGGDEAIHAFGFDKYLVFEPFYVDDEAIENLYRYKNPRLYENGDYLPSTVTNGKYADDMFADYISNFIDSNASHPFFIYYPLSLCHMPYCPTPDDPEFSAWDPLVNPSDTTFFPSMVKYMNKKIQQVVDKIDASGLSQKTVIIFLGDNGTQREIISNYNGQRIQGGKGTTTIYGTHVPLVIKWPGAVLPNQVSTGLIDASDFLPTIADIAGINTPENFGILDGISFYPLLSGSTERLRDWIYCYWHPQLSIPKMQAWVHDEKNKLYDTTNKNLFFNINNDPLELNPIPNDQLTQSEADRKKVFQSVLNSMHN